MPNTTTKRRAKPVRRENAISKPALTRDQRKLLKKAEAVASRTGGLLALKTLAEATDAQVRGAVVPEVVELRFIRPSDLRPSGEPTRADIQRFVSSPVFDALLSIIGWVIKSSSSMTITAKGEALDYGDSERVYGAAVPILQDLVTLSRLSAQVDGPPFVISTERAMSANLHFDTCTAFAEAARQLTRINPQMKGWREIFNLLSRPDDFAVEISEEDGLDEDGRTDWDGVLD